MGGTGSKQEDQIITVGIEKATGTKFIYVPFKGGGEVAVQLVGRHVDSTVNNPIEAVAQWRAGKLRAAVRVRRQAHALQGQGHRHAVLGRHPDLQGSRRADRLRHAARHLHGARASRPDQVAFYVDLLKKVRETPDWKEFMEKGAFNHDLHDRRRVPQVARERRGARTSELMKEAGFMAK